MVTFATGGSPECINDYCGISVPVNDVDRMAQEIESICKKHPFSRQDCIKRAQHYDKKQLYEEYLKVYAKS